MIQKKILLQKHFRQEAVLQFDCGVHFVTAGTLCNMLPCLRKLEKLYVSENKHLTSILSRILAIETVGLVITLHCQ